MTSGIVGQQSESELISRIVNIVGANCGDDVIVGVGDDTAVVRGPGDANLLYTCDMQVAGVHFDFAVITPYQLGRRAIAVNLSDIASMGGEPQYALVSIAMPQSLAIKDFEQLFEGMKNIGDEFDTRIIGGNLSTTADKLVIDVFLTGKASRALRRAGAGIGDKIYVTGTLGGSTAGLQAIGALGHEANDLYPGLVRKHLEPIPRVQAGRLLATSEVITSMTDVSDGISTDLAHICEASRVGAHIISECLPRHSELAAFAQSTGIDPISLALHGGEEYELLFTATSKAASIIAEISNRVNVQITEIGEIVSAQSGITVSDDGVSRPIISQGWGHFGSGNR